jgi:plastocyanin
MHKAWIAIVLGALILVGCGDDSGDEAAEDIPAPGAQATTTPGGVVAHDHGPGAGEQGCPAATRSLRIVASNTRFDTDCLTGTADQPLTLTYENKDQIGHNLVFVPDHSATDPMFRVDIFQGPRTQTLNVPAQKAGTYAFHCEVHPGVMRGTFVVK